MEIPKSSSVNGCLGDSKSFPPGFRFHPTDEELVLYYLKRKICRRRITLDIVGETDVYKWDPEELPGLSILKTGDRQWFFFCPRDRKYPNGGRANRATRHGYWKATGKDRNIAWNSREVGIKKTLVFYKGRAPCGERTDWVMHEYTMKEEELQRCKAAKDCYALYKVYKKSGPGPKNGEQYGAPFREEEWGGDDDDDPVDSQPTYPENSVQQLNVSASVDHSYVAYDQCHTTPTNDMEEFFRRIADEPEMNQPQRHTPTPTNDMEEFFRQIADEPEMNQLQYDGLAYDALAHVGYEEETQSTLVAPSLGEGISTDPTMLLHPYEAQNDVLASYETCSTTSYLKAYDAPEVTSAPNIHEQDSPVIEDFLEVDDLISPKPSIPNMETDKNNLFIGDVDGLNGPDLYFDAPLFLHDLGGSLDPRTASNSYFDTLLDYQLLSQQLDTDYVSSQLRAHDQKCDLSAMMESNQVAMAPPTSGILQAGNSSSMDLLNGARQNLVNNEGAPESWFSSTIWNFLDSIPTNPASASENALINRAFERMSSFGRVRINGRNTDVAGREDTGEGRRRIGGSRGFLFLSVLGAVCAVLWVLMIGTTVKVLKTFLGKFISS